MMNRKVNGHTGDFIKRQAKKIAKAANLPHNQALNKAAQDAGFNNWSHFINTSKKESLLRENEQSNGAQLNEPGALASIGQIATIDPYRNLLIAATNELLQRNLISLDCPEESSPAEVDGYIFVKLFGFTSAILWQHIGYEEVRISVWWKYDHSLHPQANLTGSARESFNGSRPLANKIHYKKFVGILASGWLERRDGKFLQGKDREGIFDTYTRKGEKALLEVLPRQRPLGFGLEGKFYF